MTSLLKVGLFILTITALAPQNAWGRPVSYAGGWTAITMLDADTSSLLFHYSPTAVYSIGYRGEYNHAEKWQFHGLQGNYILNRWNQRDAQATLYLNTAFGAAYRDQAPDNAKTEPAGFLGLAADRETRRYFTSYENRLTEAGRINRSFEQKARLGVAPYIAEYGGVHTWLMLEVQHKPQRQEPVTLAPLVRLFKGASLLEAGWRSDNTALFNFTYRF